MKLRTALLGALLAFAVASCGGSDGVDGTIDTSSAEAAEDSVDRALDEAQEALEDAGVSVDDAIEDAEAFGDGVADQLEAAQNAAGGGGATLTVGDETWTFDSLLCAFGPDEIGQEGAEFVVSSLQDGTQFYVSIDSFGHSVSLDDIENFADPSVSLRSTGDDFIVLDGKNFSGAAEFMDGTTDSFETTSGTFSGTCP